MNFDLSAILARFESLLQELPGFVLPIAGIGVAVLIALGLHALAFRLILRNIDSRHTLSASLVRRSRRPLRLASILLALVIAMPMVRLPHAWERLFGHSALIVLIVLIGWTVILLLNHFTARSVSRYRFDTDDNFYARKHVTQLRVLKRATNIIIVLITAGAVLLTFDGVQEYGLSLFASAGAAGLILGLAARPVLANLIAGIQIAVTQPIRLEDVVIVENEWGWIEEIFATYVIVRIWDRRRLVVPLSYFIEQPFQNWTRESASIIGVVTWQVDYTAPIAEMRRKVQDFVKESDLWDGDVINLQVTETDKDTITIRALMSARNSPRAWDLRCEVREKMLVWLQQAHPGALPRLRGEMQMTEGALKAPHDAPRDRRAAYTS